MKVKSYIHRILRRFKIYIHHGPRSIKDDLLNVRRSWKLGQLENSVAIVEDSISGRDAGYLSIVQLAATDSNYFAKFKSNKEYREILEHVSRDQGAEYLKIINKYSLRTPELMEFCKEDFCKPLRFSYPNLGRVSPTNLRYAKVALDLVALFDDLKKFDIAEIGVGYGGQFHALTKMVTPESYTFFDLPDVCSLAKYYTESYVDCEIVPVLGDLKKTSASFDLVISNYAFSELNRELQNDYLQKVILKSKRGYLIYNDIIEGHVDTIRLGEFVTKIPGAVVLDEYPLTHPQNKLVVWGQNDLSKVVLR